MLRSALSISAAIALSLAWNSISWAEDLNSPRVTSWTLSSGKAFAVLGDQVQLKVEHLTDLVDQASCKDAPNCEKRQIVLYLDGDALHGLTATPPSDPSSGTLSFRLLRTRESEPEWSRILSQPDFQPRLMSISVGLDNKWAVPSDAPQLPLLVLPPGKTLLGATLVFLTIAAMVALAWKTELLRDSGVSPTLPARRPFSLARTQMAWWFVIILGSYWFLGTVTGDFESGFNSTALVLMGISGVTLAGSAVIDQKPPSPATPVLGKPTAFGVASPQYKLRKPAPLGAAPAGAIPVAQSQSWWLDILSDADGISIHRFQMLVWTVTLGIVFVLKVYGSLSMPEFNQALLALTGISAGTYLGVKIAQ